jgi:hypothetical protein
MGLLLASRLTRPREGEDEGERRNRADAGGELTWFRVGEYDGNGHNRNATRTQPDLNAGDRTRMGNARVEEAPKGLSDCLEDALKGI